MKKLWLMPPLALSTVLMVGCLQDEKTNTADNASKAGSINKSDPYKPNYTGPKTELNDPYLKSIQPDVPFASPSTTDSNGVPSGLGKEATAGSYVGVIPWDLSSCPVADRVNIYMDDEDSNNKSYFTSLFSPAPAGLNDNNSANTRFIMCRVAGGNFRRLKTVNYAVFNFGDPGQSCANGGINYTQTIDNENSSNNNSWSGCCGNNDPDWWSTGGAYDGYVKINVCYYPADATMADNVSFPNMISRNYGVFTEVGQDNKYVKSWGTVRSDDEDTCCPGAFNDNAQNNSWDAAFPGILNFGSGDQYGGTFTSWNYGKIKAYVP